MERLYPRYPLPGWYQALILYLPANIVYIMFFLLTAALPPSWNPWSPWSACTPGIPCLAGTQLRTRACNHPFGCLGDAMETRHCENTCSESEHRLCF
ncbi:hypothetical protein DPMN_160992 [Dreissena polymorpha]|uniref:Uncharacterized protein n=1 Tax=Dreissena polymorpha TaxID=45954 RepID=A0A9D4IS63_DREPO|nr:hypothetical protein DPMN_160992 [Dreissena polymorpha]